MREDIVGMLKNAIDHGGNPVRVAQSLINSGYSMKDVKEAYDYIIKTNQQTQQQTPRNTNQKMPTPPVYPKNSTPVQSGTISVQSPQLKPLKPLPSQKTNPAGIRKIIIMVIILVLLVISLISLIIFKDSFLDSLGL